MKPIKAVLLDIDGTLVDSNDAHARAWLDALAEAGHPVPFGRVRRLIGKGGDKLLPEVSGIDPDSEQGKHISARRSHIFKENYLPRLVAFPSARELLQRMRQSGLALVVATSAKKDEMEPLLDIIGAKPFLQAKTSSDDADNSKPDPDIIQAALEKAKVTPDQALMLGDTPYDIEAAKKAGVRTVAVRSGGWDDESLSGAIALYDGPADLLAHYESSPFARGVG